MAKFKIFIITLLIILTLNSCFIPVAQKSFFGIQVYGGMLSSVTKNPDGSIYYRTMGTVNKNINIFCKIGQFKDYLSISFELCNNGNRPIQPNYYSDKYMIIDNKGKQYSLSFDIMNYPSGPINPGDSKRYSSKYLYTKLNAVDIESVLIYLGIDEISIPTLPYDTIINDK